MAKRRKKALVIRALMMAVNLKKPPPGLIRHSNRGSQYAGTDKLTVAARQWRNECIQ